MSTGWGPYNWIRGHARVAVDAVDDDGTLHTASVVVGDADAWRGVDLVGVVELLDLYVYTPAIEDQFIALFLSERDFLWGQPPWKLDIRWCRPRSKRPSQRWKVQLALKHRR